MRTLEVFGWACLTFSLVTFAAIAVLWTAMHQLPPTLLLSNQEELEVWFGWQCYRSLIPAALAAGMVLAVGSRTNKVSATVTEP